VRIRASAPAKLVLLGEYAVLAGAPALVAAVNRRVHVELEPSDNKGWIFETDMGGERRAEVRWTDEGPAVSPDDGSEDWCLPLARVLEGLCNDAGIRPERPPACRVNIRSAELFEDEGNQKLGLGSSAAVVVALAAALRRALAIWGYEKGDPEPLDEFRRDLALHHAMQGGRGSGVDVAAAYHGGLHAYRRDDASVEPIELPDGVVFQAVWTGRSTSTGAFLERVEAAKKARPDAHRAALGSLCTLARAGLAACRANEAKAFLDSVCAYHEALADFGRLCDVPIVSPAHAELAALAAKAGAIYKPSGAGGGDVGLLFARSAETLCQTGRVTEAVGYRLVDLVIETQGVQARRYEGQAS